jgi:lysophospholipase L1-like esterase
VTDPLTTADRSKLQSATLGATEAGWDESNAPSWATGTMTHNAKAVEDRLTALLADLVDQGDRLRTDLGLGPTRTIKVYCVGDSITSGAYSQDGTGYRRYLPGHLGRRRIAPTISVCAYPGQTLRYVAPIALAALPTVQPDVVLVHLGTNDAMQNDMADWQNRLDAFIGSILASSPTVRVVVARIGLNRDATVNARQASINGYIDAVVSARQAGGRVTSADMVPVCPSRWTVDGIHPMDTSYRLMSGVWTEAIMRILPAS